MTSDNLPIELWTYIAGFCRRQNLHSLSMVNTTALYGVRPILFRKVVVRPSWVKFNPSAVQNLIQEDPSKLRFVFQVRVTSDVLTSSRETCAMILNLLAGCKNAQAMVLTGWPFYPEAGRKFLDLMCTGQWKSFSYPWEADNAAKFHLINFDRKGWGAITGLTEVILGTASLLRGTHQFLHASASTITHLTLSKVDRTILARLSLTSHGNITINIRLPQLSYFECTTDSSPVNDLYLSQSPSTFVTSFLKAHPTIQHLRLHCGNRHCYMDHHCTIDPALVHADFLPHLKILATDISALSILASQGVKSLEMVEEVVTGDMTSAEQRDHLAEARAHMDLCLSIIRDSGGLLNVKQFTLLVKKSSCEESSSRMTIAQMRMIANIVPSVEEWTANGGALEGASEKELIEMFVEFKQLRVVRFRGISEEAFRALIVKCIPQAVAALETLYCEAVDTSAS